MNTASLSWRFFVTLVFVCASLLSRAEQNFQLQLLGHYTAPSGFTIRNVAVRDNLVFAAIVGGGMKIFDVSNVAEPRELSSLALPGESSKIFIDGNFAYIAAGSIALQIIDIADPAQPRLVGSLTSPFIPNAVGVVVKGDTGFIASSWGLYAIDISDPTNPSIRKAVTTRYTTDVMLDGARLFATQTPDCSIFDISDPHSPTLLASQNIAARPYRIQPIGDYLYAAADLDFKVYRYNISNPGAPTFDRYFVGVPAGSADLIAVLPTHLYAFLDDSVYIQALADPETAQPTRVIMGSTYVSITVGGGRLFGVTTNGVDILDVTNPTQPARLGQINTGICGNDVDVAVSIAYVASGAAGLDILDVSSPGAIKRIANVRTAGEAMKVKMNGSFACVAAGVAGLEIVNVSDPQAARVIGRYDTPGKAVDLFVDENTNVAYIADSWGGLQIIDVNDSTQPKLLATVPDKYGEYVTAITVQNHNAFFAGAAVAFLDVRDPANPHPFASEFFGHASWISATTNLIYLGGTHVIGYTNYDIVDLKPAGKIDSTDGVLAANYLYLTDGSALSVYDVTDPVNAKLLITETNRPARGVAVSGNRVYVSDAAGGLSVFQSGLPPRLIVTPPPTGAHFRAGDTVTIEWTAENITSPIWKLILQGTVLDGSAGLGLDGIWRAQITIPNSVTNSLAEHIAIQEQTTGVEAAYAPFIVEEMPNLQIQRFGAEFVVRWNNIHTEYTLYTSSDLGIGWTKAPTNTDNLFYSGDYRIFQDQIGTSSHFYQLRRETP